MTCDLPVYGMYGPNPRILQNCCLGDQCSQVVWQIGEVRKQLYTLQSSKASHEYSTAIPKSHCASEVIVNLACTNTPRSLLFVYRLEPDSETNRSDSETRVLKLGF